MYLGTEKHLIFSRFYLNLMTFGILSTIALFVLYLFSFFISNDVGQYEILWNELKYLNLKEILGVERNTSVSYTRIEPFSLIIFWTITQFFNAFITFYLMGALALSMKIYLLKKYVESSLLAIVFYVLLFAWALEANAIRAALSTCVIIYALVCESSKQRYLLLALAAALFHYSGIILVALYLLKFSRKPLILVPLGITAVLALSLIWNLVMSYLGLDMYLSTIEGDVNIFSSVAICQYGIIIVSFFNWKNLNENQQRGVYFMMIGAAVYIAFSDTPVIAHRIRELSLLGLLPLLFINYRRINYYMFICYFLSVYIVGYVAIDTFTRFF